MKKYVILLIFALSVFYGCDAMGIKQTDKSSDNVLQNIDVNASSKTFDNQISASVGQQEQADEIAKLQNEIDELVSAVNTKDVAIAELENKMKVLDEENKQMSSKAASVTAELVDLKDTISTSNQYRNIAIIVAVISLLFNALLVYLYINARMRSKRAALPPAKEDVHIDNSTKDTAEENVEEKDVITPEPSDTADTISEDESGNEATGNENNVENKPVRKRGRPKKVNDSSSNNEVKKPAAKRGRPRKEKSE